MTTPEIIVTDDPAETVWSVLRYAAEESAARYGLFITVGFREIRPGLGRVVIVNLDLWLKYEIPYNALDNFDNPLAIREYKILIDESLRRMAEIRDTE